MLLDDVIRHIKAANQELASVAEAIEAADKDSGRALALMQAAGGRREIEGLEELRARLSDVAGQITASRVAVDDCITTAEDIKYGTGPRVAPLSPPALSPEALTSESRRRAYAGAIVGGIWVMLSILWSFAAWLWPRWERYDQWWAPMNSVVLAVYMWTTMFGSARPFRKGTYVLLWITAGLAAAVPFVVHVIGHSFSPHSLLASIILFVTTVTLAMVYRRKQSSPESSAQVKEQSERARTDASDAGSAGLV